MHGGSRPKENDYRRKSFAAWPYRIDACRQFSSLVYRISLSSRIFGWFSSSRIFTSDYRRLNHIYTLN